MADKAELKGIAWDHPRGYEPLRAVSKEFTELHPDVEVDWDVRSLQEFGDMPVEQLIEVYDIITVDHPFMGQADADKLLLPLEEFISDTELQELANQSVGPSFGTYRYRGHQYALPIDAAAQVAAFRGDLFNKFGLTVPKTQSELRSFYKKKPKSYSVAWAMCATDLWCSFLTLCAQKSGRDFIKDFKIEMEAGVHALDQLKYHLERVHPESIHWNPIQTLDKMGNSDEIIYAPYLFGYTNYARKGYVKNRITFCNSPVNLNLPISTVLGGVGLAVSSKCTHGASASAFVAYVANAETQTKTYTRNAGATRESKGLGKQGQQRIMQPFF